MPENMGNDNSVEQERESHQRETGGNGLQIQRVGDQSFTALKTTEGLFSFNATAGHLLFPAL